MTVCGPMEPRMALSACDAVEGIERNSAVARRESKNRGVAGWCPGGKSACGAGPGNEGVSGFKGVGCKDCDTCKGGPPPYSRAIHILRRD
jgi:hypothetical protein